MYNGVIVDSKGNEIEYSYHDGKFYKVKTTIINSFANQYLNYSYKSTNDRLTNYKIDLYGTIQDTHYKLDIEDNFKIYLDDEFSEYHLSNDNYWVMGDYIKLIPVLTPKDCTDRTVTWKIQNSNIAKINFNGVITAWNIGETTAIASTAKSVAFFIPFLKMIGFAPAAIFFIPSLTNACAKTVAVVVPSPAASLVLTATSFTS